MLQKINIVGIDFSNIDEQELFCLLEQNLQQKTKTQVCFVPTNSILYARKDRAVQQVYNDAAIVMCDGVPVKWASQFLGVPLKQRLTGFDFMPRFVALAAAKGYSLFFLGAGEGVAESLALQYSSKYPAIKIAGYHTPSFSKQFTDTENNNIIDLINAAQPDVLFVSLTAPKQDVWIAHHLQQLHVGVAVGIGAAFDTEAGRVKRSPLFFQRSGFEWLYRFCMEPRRLFRRYFLEAPQFIPLVLLQKFGMLDPQKNNH